MKNKKGAELTIGTIVIIILALIVLVVIIYGFSVGWGNFFQQILGYGGGKVNVQTVVNSCQLACSTGAKYDWCTKGRSVVFNESGSAVITTCSNLVLGKDNTGAVITATSIGLEACGAISCETTPTPVPVPSG